MKYHRWVGDNGDCVKCANCGIGVNAKVKPRRVTTCPPTWLDLRIIDRLWYGSISAGTMEFDGLNVLKE